MGSEEKLINLKETFKTAVLDAMETFIPSKTITVKHNNLPWIIHPIKRAIGRRNTRRLFKKSANPNKSRPTKSRRPVQSEIKKAF